MEQTLARVLFVHTSCGNNQPLEWLRQELERKTLWTHKVCTDKSIGQLIPQYRPTHVVFFDPLDPILLSYFVKQYPEIHWLFWSTQIDHLEKYLRAGVEIGTTEANRILLGCTTKRSLLWKVHALPMPLCEDNYAKISGLRASSPLRVGIWNANKSHLTQLAGLLSDRAHEQTDVEIYTDMGGDGSTLLQLRALFDNMVEHRLIILPLEQLDQTNVHLALQLGSSDYEVAELVRRGILTVSDASWLPSMCRCSLDPMDIGYTASYVLWLSRWGIPQRKAMKRLQQINEQAVSAWANWLGV